MTVEIVYSIGGFLLWSALCFGIGFGLAKKKYNAEVKEDEE